MSTYKGSHLSIFDELDVHPEEGKIYHKHDKFWGKYYKSIKAKKGQEAGCLSNQSGRWKICVTNNKKSKSYLRSSLIDLYKHGNWCPKDLEIDHINRDQSDDRICNLRRVSRQKMFRIQLLGHNVVTNLYIIIKMVGMLDLLAPIRVKCVGVALIQH